MSKKVLALIEGLEGKLPPPVRKQKENTMKRILSDVSFRAKELRGQRNYMLGAAVNMALPRIDTIEGHILDRIEFSENGAMVEMTIVYREVEDESTEKMDV